MNDELQWIEKWLDFKRHNEGRSKMTLYAYRLALHRLRDWLDAQGKTFRTASAENLEFYTGRYLHEQKMKPSTRRMPVAAIRGFYAWAYARGLLAQNPAAALPAPRAGRPLPRAMSLTNAEKLLLAPGLDTFAGCRDTAILAVLIGSGCRVSGAVNLDEEDLIWTQTPSGTERLVLHLTEKGKKERLVPLSMEAALLLRAYLGHHELATIDRTLPNRRTALFVNVRNRTCPAHEYHGEQRRLRRKAVQRMIRRYGQALGIPEDQCHPHALRHLYGAELAEEDVDLIQRQVLLGHVSPDTTEIYSHLAFRKLAATVDRANPMAKMSNTPARALANRLARSSAGRNR